MSTPGSRAMAVGLTVMLLSVSAGMHSGSISGFVLLLTFMGVLAGVSLVAAGVRMADVPAPTFPLPAAFGGARALAAFVRRNTSTLGLVVASCAFTVVSVSGEADPVLCFGMFSLFLLGVGVSLINMRARGE